ncbi:MAG: response regulator, partial [Limnobacter sp.]|nr:response regulator [Limnobacter sp.]
MDDISPLNGKAVLIVDNAIPTRRALQEQMSQLGAKQIVFAGSVSEVEGHLTGRDFSLIVCEYILEGDRSGQQLLEELRLQKRLPWFTAFMMVTGERTYSNVVSVAEFEPDDYLIKPFTASALSERVIRIFNRKHRLSKAYEAMYDTRYEEVSALCMQLSGDFPQYSRELERMRIEAIYHLKRFDQAETELEQALGANERPWMPFLLAKIKTEKKEFAGAEELLSRVVHEH